jgi:hypothetical protein
VRQLLLLLLVDRGHDFDIEHDPDEHDDDAQAQVKTGLLGRR